MLGVYWLYIAAKGYRTDDNVRWARQVFGISILTITALSLMMSLDATLMPSTPMWTSMS